MCILPCYFPFNNLFGFSEILKMCGHALFPLRIKYTINIYLVVNSSILVSIKYCIFYCVNRVWINSMLGRASMYCHTKDNEDVYSKWIYFKIAILTKIYSEEWLISLSKVVASYLYLLQACFMMMYMWHVVKFESL